MAIFFDFHTSAEKKHLMQYDTSFIRGCHDLGKTIGKIRYHYFQNWDLKKKS